MWGAWQMIWQLANSLAKKGVDRVDSFAFPVMLFQFHLVAFGCSGIMLLYQCLLVCFSNVNWICTSFFME